MKPIIEKKQQEANYLAEELKTAKSFLVFEYLGLSAKKITELRNKLHKSNAKMYVSKNNIFNRALASANISEIKDITGPNAIIISKGDEIAPFKEIHEIMKDHKFIVFKGGIAESNFISSDKLSQIASIPGREGLYSMLLSCLQGSIRNFLYGLKAIESQKQ